MSGVDLAGDGYRQWIERLSRDRRYINFGVAAAAMGGGLVGWSWSDTGASAADQPRWMDIGSALVWGAFLIWGAWYGLRNRISSVERLDD